MYGIAAVMADGDAKEPPDGAVQPSPPMWEVGAEVDAQEVGTGVWRAAKVVSMGPEGMHYTVEFEGLEDPWQQKQTPPASIACKGTKLERWRLFSGGEDLEIQVDGSWSYGKVFMVYEKRWFAAVITSVDHDARTLSVQYKGWPPQPPATVARTGIDMTRESGLSFDSQRIRRLPPSVALDFQVGEEVEVCLDRQADDRRWVHWRYAGPRGVGVLGREGDPMENTVGVDVLGDGSFSGCTLTGSRKYVFVRADSPDLSRGGVHISPFLPPTVRRRVG